MIATVNRALLLILALLMFVGAPAAAVTYPPVPTGPILDQADLLPPDREAALDARLRALTKQTGRVMVVVTVPSLQGETIEMYAVKLFEAWGIGGKESDQGLLLLVAPNERKVRIEVGYGLHGYVTDGLSGRIIRNEITPRFKNGDMAGGIEAGANALLTQMARTPQDAKAVAEAAEAAAKAERRGGARNGDIFKAIPIVLIMILVLLTFARAGSRGGRRYRSGGGGVSPIVIWAASEILDSALRGGRGGGGGGGWGSGGGGGGGGGFGGFGGGGSGGGGASGGW